jgi:hypothetical protein
MQKIWIDINTPKQVVYFNRLIKILQDNGYEVIVTSRIYRELNQMLEMYEINAFIAGKHGGKTLRGKLEASLDRAKRLTEIVSKEKPDILISLNSDVAARVAFGLQIPHISSSDCPFATAINKLTCPLLTKLLTPKAIKLEEWLQFGITADKIIQYDAVDSVAWVKYLKPDPEILSDLQLKEDDLIIVLRPEETFAAYVLDLGIEEPVIFPTIRGILQEFPEAKIIALPRYEEHIKQFKQTFQDKIIIPEKVIDVPSLLNFASLVMGFGGTITQEGAIMGIPAISCYKGELWCDDYLEEKGLLYKAKTPEEAAQIALKILRERDYYLSYHKELAQKELQKMEDPIEKFANVVIDYLNTLNNNLKQEMPKCSENEG